MSQPIEDTIMKNIMELFKGDAVQFFGINARVIASARNELTHIPIQRKTDDWLWETDDDTYLHFEFQSDYDKKDLTRFEQAILLSKDMPTQSEQAQIQEMLKVLAEKFIKDIDVLRKLKEMIRMGIINEMIAHDRDIEIAKNMLRDGMGISAIMKYTGLSESEVRTLKSELDAA